jgi:hypothetical protein
MRFIIVSIPFAAEHHDTNSDAGFGLFGVYLLLERNVEAGFSEIPNLMKLSKSNAIRSGTIEAFGSTACS